MAWLSGKLQGLRLAALVCAGYALQGAGPFLEFRGMANASAAVRVGDDRFLVGSDENNTLLLYRSENDGEPLASFNVSRWLDLGPRPGEADLEGAARLGNVLFWIGSHSRNGSGENRPDRRRLVALRIDGEDTSPVLERVGRPVTDLLDQLIAAPSLARLHLAAAAELAPEVPGGFNIEGLTVGPGDTLWIGLRNPVPEGKALLIPLKNPLAVVEGEAAQFGEPVQLDLGGHGVRDLAWTGREFFLIGGSFGDGGKSHLYRWAGVGTLPKRLEVPSLKSLNPEALVVFGTPEKPRLLVLSDDGGRSANQTRKLSQRSFRALWVEP